MSDARLIERWLPIGALGEESIRYDEALRLARAVGVDLDREVVGWLAEKKGSELRLWDSARRAAAGTLGPKDGSRGMIDVLHRAADLGRTGTLGDARDMLNDHLGARERSFLAALEAVLPVTSRWTRIDLPSEAAPARRRLRGAVPSDAAGIQRPDRRTGATQAVAGRRRLTAPAACRVTPLVESRRRLLLGRLTNGGVRLLPEPPELGLVDSRGSCYGRPWDISAQKSLDGAQYAFLATLP